jgi:DNA-binding IclR family transcriptional regulator
MKVLARQQAGLTVSELAVATALPVSTMHRLLQVLVDEDFLMRTPRGKRYLLGPAVRELLAGTDGAFVRQVAETFLADLNHETQETVFLSELVGTSVVCFSVRDGIRPIRFLVRPGGTLPLHAAAAARAILAFLPDAMRSYVLDGHEYTRWTSHTIGSPSELYRHLDETRRIGYDICDDELENRVWAVGAPVFDLTGAVRASLTVVAPLDSVRDQARRDFITSRTVAVAGDVSSEIGFLGAAKQPS